MTDAEVGPWVRRFVLGFLAAFVLCGLLSIEVWPLTGFRLYHERRGPQREDWALVVVDHTGAETGASLKALPVAYRTTTRLIADFPHRSAAGRDAVCAAWADALRARGREVALLRVYRATFDVRRDEEVSRRLRYECARERAP